MTASILRETGAAVGLFTSPHLFALNERFKIGGVDVADEELAPLWGRVVAACETYQGARAERVGGFEFLFLIAASWFAERRCAYTVWEAGIGGRYDPTRLIAPRRIALTSLDLEHTALLGDTLEAIASDKLGAAPARATAFVGAPCAPLWGHIEGQCAERGVAAQLVPVSNSAPLPGAHQRANAALAVALARDMAPLSEDAVGRGLAATRWPGRLEILQTDPLVVIDVGHTPDAIAAALEGFESMAPGGTRVLACGASIDKDSAAIVELLAPGFSAIVCASARHKGRPAGEIAALAAAANPGADLVVSESIADARRAALAKATGPGAAIYVAGGLFLAAEFKAAHLGLDPAALAFF